MLFKGSGVAIVTPFNQNGSIDYPSYEKLLEWHVKEGTDAIIVCGTTGEAATMEVSEKKELVKFTIEKINSRIPVIVGVGGNYTDKVIKMSQYSESVGADGLLVVTPYYNRATQEGLIAHFTAIANSTKLPIMMYNVPGRTGCNMLPATVMELSKVENIVAVKEASGDISQIAEVVRLTPSDFSIYSGNDDQILPVLSLGGVGVVSVLANVLPSETSNLVHTYLKGNLEEATKMQLKYNALVKALFIENNPMPVKKALEVMGKIKGYMRLPLVEVKESSTVVINEELKKLDLI
ncbi:MAG: 4-hydroxy-tetrahydrodipicolinate synthase [Clostridia bacterium]